jgi:hypothetical protein
VAAYISWFGGTLRHNIPTMTALLLIGALGRSAHAGVVTFDFEDQVFGADTPLSITQLSLTASFSSRADPGAFGITAAFGLWPEMSGNVLASPGSAFVSGVPLTITFSRPVHAVDFQFGLGSIDPAGMIEVDTDAGGRASESGTVPIGSLLPQGDMAFSGNYFTVLTLTSNTLDFGIDNLQVDLPEPASLAVLSLGLLGIGLIRRRAP